jgi:oligopeptide/dipeptide ABC transporter ATP-binding protein
MDGKISLSVNELKVHYGTPTGDIIAVNSISFDVNKGEALGLVGESGCGKSTAAYGILRLVQPPGKILGGTVSIDGTEVNDLSDEDFRKLRGTKLALIPQGAMNSLNPTMKVFGQIKDQIQAHEGKQNSNEIKDRILNLLSKVGLPKRTYNMYPHELSGGMKQRVCIAIGIALHPNLVIADESTSALDVVVQRVVAQTLSQIQKEMGVSMIMISHDMGLMAQMVDRIAVMYAGNIVEISPTNQLFKNPSHPYSKILIESIPSIKDKNPLKLVEGITHDPRRPPPGCIFQLRCPLVEPRCKETPPSMKKISNGREVSCHLVS